MALTLHRSQEVKGTEESSSIQPPHCIPLTTFQKGALQTCPKATTLEQEQPALWLSLPTSSFLPTFRPKPSGLRHIRTKEQSFPGGPMVVQGPCFWPQGLQSDPWSGNQDATCHTGKLNK